MQDGYGNGDAVCEGWWYYHNQNWHLALGRWGVRYLNDLIGKNMVLPHLIVFIYSLIVIVSVLILKELLKIKSLITVGLSAAIMMVNTCVISQLEFRHVALSMGFSLLFTMIFAFCARFGKIWINCIGVACTVLFMGLYQSYISVIAVVTLETIVMNAISGRAMMPDRNDGNDTDKATSIIKDSLIYLLRSIIAGGVGCIIYFVILKLEFGRWNSEEAERMAGFSVTDTFLRLPKSIVAAYKQFFLFFNDIMLSRYFVYRLIFLIMAISLIFIIVNMIKSRQWRRLALMCIAGILIPVAAYLIIIILPKAGISNQMSYQYFLIIPFALALIERGAEACAQNAQGLKKTYPIGLLTNIVKAISYILVFIIACTYIINANATFRAYELSYNSVKSQFERILDRVYELDGFVVDETAIIPVGVVDDSAVRRTQGEIYQYAIDDFPSSVYSWGGYNIVKDARYYYMTGMLGVDPKYSVDEPMAEVYDNIINSDEFKSMPLWPTEGSVAMIDGVAVVKLTDDPPPTE